MSIDLDPADDPVLSGRPMERGRLAGRLVDGADVIVGGVSVGRLEPRWLRTLRRVGYDATVDEPVEFTLTEGDRVVAVHQDVRAALIDARARLGQGSNATKMRVVCRTRSGLRADVAGGADVDGFIAGALDDPPIRTIDDSAWERD